MPIVRPVSMRRPEDVPPIEYESKRHHHWLIRQIVKDGEVRFKAEQDPEKNKRFWYQSRRHDSAEIHGGRVTFIAVTSARAIETIELYERSLFLACPRCGAENHREEEQCFNCDSFMFSNY